MILTELRGENAIAKPQRISILMKSFRNTFDAIFLSEQSSAEDLFTWAGSFLGKATLSRMENNQINEWLFVRSTYYCIEWSLSFRYSYEGGFNIFNVAISKLLNCVFHPTRANNFSRDFAKKKNPQTHAQKLSNVSCMQFESIFSC